MGTATVFKMTPRETLTTLFAFNQDEVNGATYSSSRLLLKDGMGIFIGTDLGGRRKMCYGTVFKMNAPRGKRTTLYSS